MLLLSDRFPTPMGQLGSSPSRPLRYAVLGAGFAGLSVTWHLLKHSHNDSNVRIDVYDEAGIGGGASGVSGGLLHPYSPKESAAGLGNSPYDPDNFVMRRRSEEKDYPALFLACENLSKDLSDSFHGQKDLNLHKKSIQKLVDLEGQYDAVIVCLGAKAEMLPELFGKLPLRTCRGVIVHLELPHTLREEYPDSAPSILSDAWLAIRGTRSIYMGSTWEWTSRNASPRVSADDASKAFLELISKASVFYPGIVDWTLTEARAGLRAMPPLTSHGSLPLLGCVDNFVGEDCSCKYCFFGGLGSRGLFYHACLGNLMAQAVISRNENLIPSELTGWKNINR